jgi:hypothetical protein
MFHLESHGIASFYQPASLARFEVRNFAALKRDFHCPAP